MSPRGRLSRKQRARAEAGTPPDIVSERAITVDPGESGERLDRVVAARLPELSRARVQALIEQGLVLVDGAPGRSAARLTPGSRIAVSLPRPVATALVPVELHLPVLYDDRYLLVIDKPAGLAVHPGAGVPHATVVHGLLHQLADLAGIGGELRPGIVHRLDKDTSGCLVVAKSEPALRGLQAAFKARTVEKRYRALVHGAPPDAGEIDTLYGRHATDRKRFSSKVREGRRAVTRYRVLGRGGGAALIDVTLLTGRTHQIRAHFADLGFPLLGDRLYGGTRRELKLPPAAPARLAALRLGRQGLHAHHLAFAHPITSVPISCTAPLPVEFREALALLGIAPG